MPSAIGSMVVIREAQAAPSSKFQTFFKTERPVLFSRKMNAGIISCGEELVTGQCVDTNSAWLSEQLTAHGVRVAEHITVGDEIEDIRDAVRWSLERAELVIITGGLGPTGDDLTREGIAAAIGQPLEESADALLQIRTFFERWRRDMPESNRIQAMIPKGCAVIPNLRGTAPGIAYENGTRRMYALPGVPAEMREMFEATVRPTLRSAQGAACTLTARLLCYGISEAKLGEAIADLMTRGRNPLVGTTASNAILTVRVLARGDDVESARRLLDADCNEIRHRLGHVVFGESDEKIQGAVARLLIEQGKT
ncbi:MAG: molybdopterin-binding protein, partial [Phycisphaerales bacterium]|nr:molybdopterin-binding protein [Phycisphaerales bacterium]